MPNLQDPNDAALLKQIEDMLAKGMNEDQILTQMGVQVQPSAPLPTPTAAQTLQKATSIGPAPSRVQGFPAFIREMLMGIKHPLDMDTQEYTGSLPLPFTDLRIGAGDAVSGLLGGGVFTPMAGRGAGRAVGALMEQLPSARRSRAIGWANEQFPYRLTNPNRLLGPGTPSVPDFPHGLIDDIPVQTPDLPRGFTDFIPQETFESAVYGTMPPVKSIRVAPRVQEEATKKALRPKKGK